MVDFYHFETPTSLLGLQNEIQPANFFSPFFNQKIILKNRMLTIDLGIPIHKPSSSWLVN